MRNNKFDTKYIMIILLAVVIIAVIAAVIIFMSAGKGKTKKQEKPPVTADGKEYYMPTEEEKSKAKELTTKLKNQLPTINGGLDTIALESMIASELQGENQLEKEKKIIHTTEEQAFNDLLAGRCELVFSSKLLEEQEKEAAAKNIPLEIKPIMYHALVFIVNEKNPVTELTEEEIKGIFSGKITNWQEVGGDDAEIILYQHTENSDEQKLMINFMGQEKLLEAKTEAVPGEKFGLIETVATYSNEENAIGYELYRYPESFLTKNGMKYIKVNGIDVNKEKMAFGEYPLLEYKYAIYNTSKTSTSYADELAEWLTIYAGQVLIDKAGYIPVKNIQVKEQTLPIKTELGASEEKRENELSDFYYMVAPQDYGEVGQDSMIVGIRGLKDRELEKNINEFLRESIEAMQSKNREYEEYIETLPSGYTKNKITVQTECKNGYFGIQVLLTYKSPKGYIHVYDGCSTVYDLYSGKELSLEELYYKDTDNLTIINHQIESIIASNLATDTGYIEQKRLFEGITDDIYVYGIDSITFTNNNIYFSKGVTFELDTYFDDISIVNKARNMEEIWEDNTKIQKVGIYHKGNGSKQQKGNVQIQEIQNCLYNVFFFHGSREEISDRVNQIMAAHVDNTKIAELIKQAYNRNQNERFILNEKNQYQVTISYETVGDKYISIMITANPEESKIILGSLILDLDTGEVASEEDRQNWKNENGIQ